MIRGGLASVYSSRLEIANNSLLSNFDESKEPSSILYIDANNLYGGVMLHYPLPLKDFEIVEEMSLEDILNTDDEGDIGYIVEVDLNYPDDLHDKHSDFPLISDKEPVDPIELSEYQSELKTALNVSNSKTKKLRQTYHSKMNYVTHYRNLKFFISKGIKVNKLHRAVKFCQSKWLSTYIQLSTNKRQQAESKLNQDFYKLMSNSAFGKLCESLRNRVTVTFVRNDVELLNATSQGTISSIKIVDQDLSLITKKKQSISWTKPTIVGASILELSKLFMMDFLYNVMKIETECTLLYSDTDSFIYKIKSPNFYEDLAKNSRLRSHFDLSNFPENHQLHDRSNEKTVLKFKDELAGMPIEEFCALKPKLYSIIAGQNAKMSAKGTKKYAQTKLTHEMFKKTLQKSDLLRLENIKFSSEKHQIHTVCVNKTALSAYDDKRYINTDRTTTIPFGHYSLREEIFAKKICEDVDWGVEPPEMDTVFELPERGEASGWETPDPGFNQPSYSNEQLNDVVDFNLISDQEDETNQETPNPFILLEAEESPTTSTSTENFSLEKIRKRKAISPKTDDEADSSEILLSPIISREGQESTLQSSEESPLLLYKRTRAYIDDSESD